MKKKKTLEGQALREGGERGCSSQSEGNARSVRGDRSRLAGTDCDLYKEENHDRILLGKRKKRGRNFFPR